jgi:hypothetical protein
LQRVDLLGCDIDGLLLLVDGVACGDGFEDLGGLGDVFEVAVFDYEFLCET